jgi:hypothetical protein
MVTMIDEIFDRSYQSGRSQLNAGLDTLFAHFANGLGNAFRVLNRIEYDAPWRATGRRRGRA